MSLRHVVMFRWANHVEGAHVDRVRAGLDALPAQIEQIRRYVHGPDVGLRDTNWDYVVVADFDSAADFVIYRDHPVHQQLITDLITGFVDDRAAVQYET